MNLRNGVFPVLLIMPLNREKALLLIQSINFAPCCIVMYPRLWNILMTLRMCANYNDLIIYFLQIEKLIYKIFMLLRCLFVFLFCCSVKHLTGHKAIKAMFTIFSCDLLISCWHCNPEPFFSSSN